MCLKHNMINIIGSV